MRRRPGCPSRCGALLAAVVAAVPAAAIPPGTPSPGTAAPPEMPTVPALVEEYVERYFATYPTRGTAAGRTDLDHELEDLSPERLEEWLAFVAATAESLRLVLAEAGLDAEDRADGQLLWREAAREAHDLATLDRPGRDPLWWSEKIAAAHVFLLAREERPAEERVEAVEARARQLPRLVAQARAALAAAAPERVAPELAALAGRQLRSTAAFYRDGLAAAVGGPEQAERLRAVGAEAAAAIDGLADLADELARTATGSPRLGAHYAETFRLGTGVERPVAEVLAAAEAALTARRAEAVCAGRAAWPEVFPGELPPADDGELLRRLFRRLEEDRPATAEELLADYRGMVDEVLTFVREHDVVGIPEPFTVRVELSPDTFLGQSVGGVYPAGPWDPEGETLLFLPTPPSDAPLEGREALFRAFNDHFNRMIVPHELVPGHALQLAWAARHPRRVRALFPDGVVVEGWGTFAERLLLDLGWGGPLDRLAHLKKQLENIARTIADIRVHTTDVGRQELLAFVRDEALQDEQLAANLWLRAITSSPQLVTYHLGYEAVGELFAAARQAAGEGFSLRAFTDGVMAAGAVPPAALRRRLVATAPEPPPADVPVAP